MFLRGRSDRLPIAALLAACLLGVLPHGATASHLFVANDYSVVRYDLDGGGGLTVYSSPGGGFKVAGLALDPLDDDLYLMVYQGHYKRFLRDNDPGTLDPSGADVDMFFYFWDNWRFLSHLAFDPIRRQAVNNEESGGYGGTTLITRRDVDSGSTTTLHSENTIQLIGWQGYYNPTPIYAPVHQIEDVAVDPLSGQVYWADRVAGTIDRRRLDGSGSWATLYSGLVNPYGIALNPGAGEVYWTAQGDASTAPTVARASMSGGGPIHHVYVGTYGDTLQGIDVDPWGGKVYWTEAGIVRRANRDGTNLEDFTNPSGDPIAGNILSFEFDPGAAPQNPLLPDATGPGQSLDFQAVAVSAGPTVFFDPDVASGYEYQTSGPNFASVLLPEVGDGLFELWLWDAGASSFVLDQQLSAGEEFFFDAGGVDRFRILGIEESAALDPGDPLAFITGLTFTASGTADVTMTPLSAPCSDGLDNDGDGLTDFGNDPGCFDASDFSEQLDCLDGIDNDGDGLTDYGADSGCRNAQWGLEDPQCSDGIDNDGDGFTDHPDDPGCMDAAATREDPRCNDGIDNDGNGLTDLADPICGNPWSGNEAADPCGLGYELALLLPPLMWLRGRRRRAPISR